jgi:hypothetical protein
MTVVKSGLKPAEQIVVSGQYRLKPGANVQPTPMQEPPVQTSAQ